VFDLKLVATGTKPLTAGIFDTFSLWIRAWL